jgi:TRAP-type C4-dicarboxylate transport system permease small subunit
MRWLDRVYAACGTAAGVVVGLMVLLVCWDVAARNIGIASLPWIVEITELALPLATLLAAPWLLHRNEHVRLDVLHNALSAKALQRLERASAALGLAVCLAVVWYTLKVIADTRAIGAMVMKSLVFPEWWLFVPLPASFGLMALEFARRLICPSAQGAAPAHLMPGED